MTSTDEQSLKDEMRGIIERSYQLGVNHERQRCLGLIDILIPLLTSARFEDWETFLRILEKIKSGAE